LKIGIVESYPGELEALTEREALERVQKGFHAALRQVGLPEAADVLEDRLDALLDAETRLTAANEQQGMCGALRKSLDPRGGELDVVAILTDRMAASYDAMSARLADRIRAEHSKHGG
jgi:hypothetical protein